MCSFFTLGVPVAHDSQTSTRRPAGRASSRDGDQRPNPTPTAGPFARRSFRVRRPGEIRARNSRLRELRVRRAADASCERAVGVHGNHHRTGHALQAIIKDNEDHVYAKTKFSMVNPETSDHLDSLEEVIAKPQALLCGLETHVCVSQTAFDLLERGWEVFILVDGVSSQRTSDRSVASRRMENAGCVLTTSEAALFELVGDARHDKFREVSKLVREPRPEVPLPVP